MMTTIRPPHLSRSYGIPLRIGVLATSASLIFFGMAYFTGGLFANAAAQAVQSAGAIGGTGRIQPGDGIIALHAPAGHRVERVTVRPGERVRKGAVLVVMADQAVRALERDSVLNRLRDAEQQYAIRAKVAALDVEAARLAAAQAREESEAVSSLDPRTIAAKEQRQRANALALAETQLKLAEARRAESRQVFDSEQKTLKMRLNIANLELATMHLVAPLDATVLEVNVQAGANAGNAPAVTLADTSRMYVVADFFEGDLPKLAIGQRVTVTNAALGLPLQGSVDRIGRIVDPVNRLAKVWVVLDLSSPADRFIGMQVDLKVDPARNSKSKGGLP